MNNLRFATLTHIFSLLGCCEGEWISSEWMAGSININPVIVRKEVAWLKKSGFVESRRGKEGGIKLIKHPKDILLGDVMRLLVLDEQFLTKKNNPNPECPVGRQMNGKLDVLYDEINKKIFGYLDKITLESFIQSLKN